MRYSLRILMLAVTLYCLYLGLFVVEFKHELTVHTNDALPFKPIYINDQVLFVYVQESGNVQTILPEKKLLNYTEYPEKDTATIMVNNWELFMLNFYPEVSIR